jgi:hypothetical protein
VIGGADPAPFYSHTGRPSVGRSRLEPNGMTPSSSTKLVPSMQNTRNASERLEVPRWRSRWPESQIGSAGTGASAGRQSRSIVRIGGSQQFAKRWAGRGCRGKIPSARTDS